MTPFKKNITKSIDNLNRICKTILSVYDNKMLSDNVLNQSGSDLTFNNTVAGGKFDWEIQGKCEQDSYSGKNLLNIESTKVVKGHTNIPCNIQAQTITISAKSVNTDGTNTIFRMEFKDSNSTVFQYFDITIATPTRTVTLTENASSIEIYSNTRVGNSSGITTTFNELMINTGSSAETYEPYVGGIPSPNPDYPQDIRVVTGDNEVVVQNKNKLNARAESYTMPASTNKYQFIGNIDLVANTKYYISYNIDNASTSNLSSTPYIRIGTGTRMYQNAGENYNITTGRKVWEFTPLETATYEFGYWINNSDVAVTISDFMISTDSDTTYVAHAEQSTTLHLGSNYLAGIGDYKDEIVGKTDDWKIVRKVRKFEFDGSVDESWNLSATYTNNARFTNSGFNYNKTNRNVLCNYFTRGQGDTDTTNIDINGSSGTLMITIPKTLASNETELRTWFSTHNTYGYAILQEETEEPVSDTTLINDLNNMYNLMGYDGQTNISIVPAVGNATPSLKVTAFVTEKEA